MKNFYRTVTGHRPTDKFLQKQGVWYDSDLIKAGLLALIVGIAVGFMLGFGVGAPDLSGFTPTGIKG